jgi:hypothetical protein
LGLLIAVLDWGGVEMPDWAFIPLFLLSIVLIVVAVVLGGSIMVSFLRRIRVSLAPAIVLEQNVEIIAPQTPSVLEAESGCIQFYENRDQLNSERGEDGICIRTELAKVSQAWVAWPGGSIARLKLVPSEIRKIRRMILRDPNDVELLRKYAQVASSAEARGVDVSGLQTDIHSTTQFAKDNNIEIK